MPSVPVLETERLLLRPLTDDDLDGFAAMMADPDVVEFLGTPPLSRPDAWRNMAVFVGHGELRGWSNNAVIDKATGEFYGRCGLWRPEGWPGLEVGWTLARGAWGKGIATEAAAAWRDWAKAHPAEVGHEDTLISVIHRDNRRSQAVARRIGHQYERDEEVRGFPCQIWSQPLSP